MPSSCRKSRTLRPSAGLQRTDRLIRRRNLRHQVADQRFVRQRLEPHLAWLEPRRAGIDHLAVQQDHAFLARVRIDAGEADRKCRILLASDLSETVEDGLSRLVRNLVTGPGRVVSALSSSYHQLRVQCHRARLPVRTGTDSNTNLPPCNRTIWFVVQLSSVCG